MHHGNILTTGETGFVLSFATTAIFAAFYKSKLSNIYFKMCLNIFAFMLFYLLWILGFFTQIISSRLNPNFSWRNEWQLAWGRECKVKIRKICRVLDEDREEHPQYCNSCCGITLCQGLIVSFNFPETEWIKMVWYTYVFPGGSMLKNLSANSGDTEDVCLIPGSGRSPGGRNSDPLQYSYLENSMNREAWWATVHGSQRVRHNWATKWVCAHSLHRQWNIAQP